MELKCVDCWAVVAVDDIFDGKVFGGAKTTVGILLGTLFHEYSVRKSVRETVVTKKSLS